MPHLHFIYSTYILFRIPGFIYNSHCFSCLFDCSIVCPSLHDFLSRSPGKILRTMSIIPDCASQSGILYIPQKSYFTEGSLLYQVKRTTAEYSHVAMLARVVECNSCNVSWEHNVTGVGNRM